MRTNKKQDILTAAGKCFVKHGYDKTTLDDIAELVGINKASFYYYFKNKEAIFIELIMKEAEEYISRVNKKVEPIADIREKISSWIRESFGYRDSNSILYQLSIESRKKLTPQLLILKDYSREKGRDFLIAVLYEYQKKGIIQTDNPERVGATIQDIIYALKEYSYQDCEMNPHDYNGFDKMVGNINYAVSLILDGIIIDKKKS